MFEFSKIHARESAFPECLEADSPSVRFSQRRASARRELQAWAFCSNVRHSFLARIENASERGFSLCSNVLPDLGTYLSISFKMPGPFVQSTLRCVVTRLFEKPAPQKILGESRGFVVEILDPPKSLERQRLRDFLDLFP